MCTVAVHEPCAAELVCVCVLKLGSVLCEHEAMPASRGIRLSARECALLLQLGIPVLLIFGGNSSRNDVAIMWMVWIMTLDINWDQLRIHLCDYIAQCGDGTLLQVGTGSTRIILHHDRHEFGGNGKCCDGRINISLGNVSFAQKYVCSEIHKVVDHEIFV